RSSQLETGPHRLLLIVESDPDRSRAERLPELEPRHRSQQPTGHELANEPHPRLAAISDVGAEVHLQVRGEAGHPPAPYPNASHAKGDETHVRAAVPAVRLDADGHEATDQVCGRFEGEQQHVAPARREKRAGHLEPLGGWTRWGWHEVVERPVPAPAAQPRSGRDGAVHEVERVGDRLLERAAESKARRIGRRERAARYVRRSRVTYTT